MTIKSKVKKNMQKCKSLDKVSFKLSMEYSSDEKLDLMLEAKTYLMLEGK